MVNKRQEDQSSNPDVVKMDHKPVNDMAVNSYLYVRRLRQRSSEHQRQCSLATTRKVVEELASGTHGKPWGEDVVNLVRESRRNVGEFDAL